ncbi:helix-turn-helix domain-containing protein [Cuspidothrix issatschenkoi LEGE 03284]|uniref:helix-turn-helix domain-containing protein n=1 Tax=Cuspidothrix issatschenkoi TaxID=230752 RepID=UPI0018825F8F|nr:helix-turn-helix domain-containing protein [Cuspidothrix issatschenkoi]MBE9233320.1 helix-turn-helix domain-containing protein [Cuspidothrix issatschenkoi LEGE 03284]
MSKSEERLRIFELFRRGISVSEVSKTSKIPQRTLYRWYEQWKSKEDKEEDSPIINEVVQKTKQATENELNSVDFRDDWINVVGRESIQHSLVNGQIAKALSNILIKEIQKQDLNYRAINALSASISIHSKLHREYGLFYLLDINKAFKLIENEGYMITEEKQDTAAAE